VSKEPTSLLLAERRIYAEIPGRAWCDHLVKGFNTKSHPNVRGHRTRAEHMQGETLATRAVWALHRYSLSGQL
jgi:hypothetical protein